MESYPTGVRAFMPSAIFGAKSPTRTPSSIGLWLKQPVRSLSDATVATLATALPDLDTQTALEHAFAVRHRLYEWTLDQPVRTGLVDHVDSAALAIAVNWRGTRQPFLDDLRRAGLVDSDGRLADWHYITSAITPQAEARLKDAIRQRRHRSADLQNGVTKRDRQVTEAPPKPPVYKERTRVTRAESEVRDSLSDAVASNAFQATGITTTVTTSRCKPRTVPVVTVATVEQATLPEAARMLVDRLAWLPTPAQVRVIIEAVGSDERDLDIWHSTLTRWSSRSWHAGPNCLPHVIDRFTRTRDRQRDHLEAKLAKAHETTTPPQTSTVAPGGPVPAKAVPAVPYVAVELPASPAPTSEMALRMKALTARWTSSTASPTGDQR